MAFGLVAVVGSLVGLIGCGDSGGGRGPSGEVCPNNYNPLPLELTNGPEKVVLDPAAGELQKLPGIYDYDGAEVFYKDSKGVNLHVMEIRSARTGKWVPKIKCANGFKLDTPEINISMTGIRQMEVAADGNTKTAIRNFVVAYRGRRVLPKFEDGDGSSIDKPSKVYDGHVGQYFLYKMDAKGTLNFQIRSETTDGEGTVYFVVKYKRIPPPPIPAI